jgi:hypothetical protein
MRSGFDPENSLENLFILMLVEINGLVNIQGPLPQPHTIQKNYTLMNNEPNKTKQKKNKYENMYERILLVNKIKREKKY